MKEIPFGILQEYLKSTDSTLNQQKVADRLHVKVDLVKSWCSKKFTISEDVGITANEIVDEFFKDNSIRRGFIARLKRSEYDIADYDDKHLPIDEFTELLREFLAENIKKKPNTPTSNDTHTDVFLYKKPKQYFPQILYTSNDNGENEVIFDFDKNNDFAKIKELHHILIEAVGGQGKSLFLSKLFESANKSDDFKHVFLIDLPDLAALTKKKPHPLADRSAYYILSYLSTISKDFLCSVKELTEDNKAFPDTILLLDGYNEVFSLSDFDALKIIDEIEYITEEWPVTVIMTSRPSTEKRRFLNNYHTCNISGTPKEKVEEIAQENSNVPYEVLRLAEIPLFYNAFAELKGKGTIKTKYGLLFHMYLKRYKQSAKSFEGFISNFVFAPLIIKHMVDKNKNRLSIEEINSFAEEFDKMNLKKFISIAAAECDVTCPIVDYDTDKIRSIFINQGPFEPISKNTLKIHDELRDFLLAFCYTIMRKVFRDSLEEGQYIYVKDLDFKINLKDNSSNLLKESLGISTGKDLYKLKDEYDVLNDCQLNPQAVCFGYSLFMLSDNLSLGTSAVTPFHEILKNFTSRICRLVKQGNFENCLKNGSSIVDEEQKIRCLLLDIMTKHCEHYRMCGEYIEGIRLTEIAKRIKPDYVPIEHQSAKLFFLIYENHVKSGSDFDLESIGFSDYVQLYEEGVKLLEKGANNNFSFCNILLATLHSNPPPYLYNNAETDYVKAFNLYRSLVFADKTKFVVKRVAYTIRQLCGLLLKGYIKFNPDFEIYEDGDPGENGVVLGDRNTLSLDQNTLKMAKYFLTNYAEGVNDTATLNYYRAIVAYFYDRDYAAARQYLDLEKDTYLKTIFLHYVFNEEADLNSKYEKVKDEINASIHGTIEGCHPIYWYMDMKSLDIAFDESRKAFFDEFEKDLPETMRNIIHNH